MDSLTSGIIGFQQAALDSKISFAIARKMLDNQEMQGSAAVKLIQAAGNMTNSAGDKLVAAATGLGSEVDTYA